MVAPITILRSMKTPAIVIFLLLVGFLLFGFPGDSIQTSWRYKTTVVIETPEGLKTGSAVREVRVRKGSRLTAESQSAVALKGEAVVIDLGERGIVFALLRGYIINVGYAADLPGNIFKRPGIGWLSYEGIRYLRDLKAAKELEPEWYPLFVRFRDIQDPKTVENLYEMERYDIPDRRIEIHYRLKKDNFEKAFGKGVRLKSVTIEMVDEPVTSKILDILPWLPEYYNLRLDGKKYDYQRAREDFVHSLTAGAFLNHGVF